MKQIKKRCRRCDGTKNVFVYWCSSNLLKMPMKTHYCEKCVERYMIDLKTQRVSEVTA